MSVTSKQSIKICFREQSEYTEYIPVNGTIAIDKFNTVTITIKTALQNICMVTKTTFYNIALLTSADWFVFIQQEHDFAPK